MNNNYELLLGLLILSSIVYATIEPGILVAIVIGIIAILIWAFTQAYLEFKYLELGKYLGYALTFIFIIIVTVFIFPFVEMFTKEQLSADIFFIIGMVYPFIMSLSAKHVDPLAYNS